MCIALQAVTPIAKKWLTIGLTYWGQDKIEAILQTTYSNAFSWVKIFVFWFKLSWSLFAMVQFTINRHLICSDNNLVPNRQQAIIWINDGLVYWPIYSSPGINVLIRNSTETTTNVIAATGTSWQHGQSTTPMKYICYFKYAVSQWNAYTPRSVCNVFDSMASEICCFNHKQGIFKHISRIDILCISWEIARR